MPIVVQCGKCGKKLKAPDRLAGKKAKCGCGCVLAIPAAAADGGDIEVRKAPARVKSAGGRKRANVKVRSEADLDAAPMMTFGCPGCKAPLNPGSVLCMKCGYDTRTGQKVNTATEAGAAAAIATGRRPVRGPGIGVVLLMLIKPAIILAIVGGMGYWGYELFTHDPVKQGRDKMAQLQIGMPLQQVVDIMGRPKKKVHIQLDGEQRAKLQANSFEREVGWVDDFLNTYGKDGGLRNGFYVEYQFATATVYQLYFDEQGKYQQNRELKHLLAR
jgi:hypothetical protein